MIPKILTVIRFIWVNSTYFNTRERLTGILKKVLCNSLSMVSVSFQIIEKTSVFIIFISVHFFQLCHLFVLVDTGLVGAKITESEDGAAVILN